MIDDTVRKQVHGFMEKASRGEKLVAIAAAIISILMRAGLAWLDDIQVTGVTFHWLNRDGMGLILEDMLELLSEVFSVGYVSELVAPVVIEVPESTEKWLDPVRSLAKQSKGKFPDVDPKDITHLALRGTHLLSSLRCVAMGALSDDASMTVDGKLSLDMLQATDINMFNAIKKGVRCTVLHKLVHKEFGDDLLQIIQVNT